MTMPTDRAEDARRLLKSTLERNYGILPSIRRKLNEALLLLELPDPPDRDEGGWLLWWAWYPVHTHDDGWAWCSNVWWRLEPGVLQYWLVVVYRRWRDI